MAGKSTRSLEDRFWEKVSEPDSNGCRVWTGAKSRKGYGVLWKDNRLQRAHRVSYELAFGEIPEGMLVCHRCDLPSCVESSHLFLGTAKENTEDMLRKNRQKKTGNYGESNGSARVSAQEADLIRDLYSTGSYTQQELGVLFGIHQTQVSNIVRRKHWNQPV